MRFFWCKYWIKIPFFRVSVTIEPGRSLLQFVTTNCLILKLTYLFFKILYTSLKLKILCSVEPRLIFENTVTQELVNSNEE